MLRKDLRPGTVFKYTTGSTDTYYVPYTKEDSVVHELLNLETSAKCSIERSKATSEGIDWEKEVVVVKLPETGGGVEPVIAQKHYTELDPQPIEIMEKWFGNNIRRACALKYLARAGLKGTKEDAIRDLDKCIAFIRREQNAIRTGTPSWSE